jgi:hypothetical protein
MYSKPLSPDRVNVESNVSQIIRYGAIPPDGIIVALPVVSISHFVPTILVAEA